MTTVGTRNGYTRLPTVDPDSSEALERRKKLAKTLRPGLFYMFGDRGRYADHYSESEETIELREVKPRRPKHRRLRGPKSPKSPKTPRIKQKFNIIEEPILPGDTVQRVALRYGCHVREWVVVILLQSVDRLNGGQDSPVASFRTWSGNEVRPPTVNGLPVTVR